MLLLLGQHAVASILAKIWAEQYRVQSPVAARNFACPRKVLSGFCSIQFYSKVPPGFPKSTAQQPRQTRQKETSIGRESLQVFFVLRALAYFQVPPLGGSREEKWRSQWIRKRSVSWNLPKMSELWLCNGGFGSCTTQNHLQTKQFLNGTWIPAEWMPVRCERWCISFN